MLLSDPLYDLLVHWVTVVGAGALYAGESPRAYRDLVWGEDSVLSASRCIT